MKIRKGVIAAFAAATMTTVAAGGAAFGVFDNASNGNTTGTATSGNTTAVNVSAAIGSCGSTNSNGTGGVQVVSRSASSCDGVHAQSRVANHTHSGNAHSGNDRINNGNHL